VQIAEEVDALPQKCATSSPAYRQEALANVHRHATATEVRVKMRTTRKILVLQIADDGKAWAA